MKIANAKTFGNDPYVTSSVVESAVEAHVSSAGHIPSGGANGNYLKKTTSGVEWANVEIPNLSATIEGEWGFTKITSANVSSIASTIAVAADDAIARYETIAVKNGSDDVGSRYTADSSNMTFTFIAGSNVTFTHESYGVKINATGGTSGAVTSAGVSTIASSVASGVVSSVAYTKTQVDGMISSVEDKLTNVYTYKGSVSAYSALPASNVEVGYVYNIESADTTHGVKAGDNVAWNGSAWDVLAGTVDLSGYAQTTTVSGWLDSKVDKVNGKGLSTEDFTSAYKTKLEGIASGAEVNQYAYKTISVQNNGSTVSINATSKTDTFKFIAGSNVALVADSANKTLTVSATNTTYDVATTTSNGLMDSAMVTKLNGITSGAEPNQSAYGIIAVSAGGSTTNVSANGTSATVTLVAGSNITLVGNNSNRTITISATDTTYGIATTTSNGLMGSAMVTKLNGIDSGAEVNQSAFKTVAVSAGGSTVNVVADSKEDTITMVAGSGIAIVGDATNDKVTFSVQVDAAITSDGANPVAGSAIFSALANKITVDDFEQVAFTGSYNDLIDKPDLSNIGAGVSAGGSAVTSIVSGGAVSLSNANGVLTISAPQTTVDGTLTSNTQNAVAGSAIWSSISAVSAAIPTVPTIGSATITLKAGGTSYGSFNVNTTTNTSANIPQATTGAFGVMKVGSGLAVANGIVSANIKQNNSAFYTVSAGSNVTLTNTNNVLTIAATDTIPNSGVMTLYAGSSGGSPATQVGTFGANQNTDSTVVIPNATDTSYGVVKIGTGLSVESGVISADIDTTNFAEVAFTGNYDDLENKPTDTGYTSFAVYANSTAISAGTNHATLGYVTSAVPAQMTCKFLIYTYQAKANCDVSVNWGDGNKTKASTDTLDYTETDPSDGMNIFVFSHTYSTEGRYVVKVYGRDYTSLKHYLGVTSKPEYADNAGASTYNLLCECFSNGLNLAPHIKNLASFARGAMRLTKVDVQDPVFYELENTSSMFLGCFNLLRFTGVGEMMQDVRSCASMFENCQSMTNCEFTLPAHGESADYLANTFALCASLANDIRSLIPNGGFCQQKIAVGKLFYGCHNLSGTIPADVLWDSDVEWLSTSLCFDDSAFEGNVPTRWGGDLNMNESDDYRNNLVLDMPLGEDAVDRCGNKVTVLLEQSTSMPFVEYDGRRCAYFNGDAALVIPAPNNGNFDFAGNGTSMTICFWVAKPSSTTWESVVNKRSDGANADYYFGFNNDSPCFYNGGAAKVASLSFSKESWHFVCYRYDKNATNFELFVDGIAIGWIAGPSMLSTSARAYLMIGGCNYSSDPQASSVSVCQELLHGYLSNVRIYNAKLTDEQIERIRHATSIDRGIPVTTITNSTTSNDSVVLHGDNTYILDYSGSMGGTTTLSCENFKGYSKVWLVDIKFINNGRIFSLDSTVFDTSNCAALTADKINRCIVKWDGTNAILYCYKTDSLS